MYFSCWVTVLENSLQPCTGTNRNISMVCKTLYEQLQQDTTESQWELHGRKVNGRSPSADADALGRTKCLLNLVNRTSVSVGKKEKQTHSGCLRGNHSLYNTSLSITCNDTLIVYDCEELQKYEERMVFNFSTQMPVCETAAWELSSVATRDEFVRLSVAECFRPARTWKNLPGNTGNNTNLSFRTSTGNPFRNLKQEGILAKHRTGLKTKIKKKVTCRNINTSVVW